LLTEITQGTVMVAEVLLSSSVQLAEGLLSRRMLVPPGLLKLLRRFTSVPAPARVTVVEPGAPKRLVKPPPMRSGPLAPLSVMLLEKLMPRSIVCVTEELFVMPVTRVMGLPVSVKAAAPGLKTILE